MYDKDGNAVAGVVHFNGCAKVNACAQRGGDGIGFGNLESYCHNDNGAWKCWGGSYNGTNTSPRLRWGTRTNAAAELKPFTYWYRPK